MARSYDMTKRAKRAERTAERIVDAAEALLERRPVGDVTLQAIADDAEVTVQTVLRHMGSRDGCLDAVRDRVRERVERQRGRAPAGDAAAAIAGLVEHYEAEGRLVLNLLAQEGAGDPQITETTEDGRRFHRRWVERCFGEAIAAAPPEARGEIRDALIAATDIYVWKMLRLDLGRSAAATEAAFTRLVRGLLEDA